MRGVFWPQSRRPRDQDPLIPSLEDQKLLDIRFMYEESPQFEIGYMWAEIIERYRKMAEMVRRVISYPDQLFHTVRILREQQFVYLDIYNLIMMIYEIPKKYKHIKEFERLHEAVLKGIPDMMAETYDDMKARIDRLAKEKKRLARLKKAKKRILTIEGIMNRMRETHTFDRFDFKKLPIRKSTPHPYTRTPKPPRTYNYGWELNYEWW